MNLSNISWYALDGFRIIRRDFYCLRAKEKRHMQKEGKNRTQLRSETRSKWQSPLCAHRIPKCWFVERQSVHKCSYHIVIRLLLARIWITLTACVCVSVVITARYVVDVYVSPHDGHQKNGNHFECVWWCGCSLQSACHCITISRNVWRHRAKWFVIICSPFFRLHLARFAIFGWIFYSAIVPQWVTFFLLDTVFSCREVVASTVQPLVWWSSQLQWQLIESQTGACVIAIIWLCGALRKCTSLRLKASK